MPEEVFASWERLAKLAPIVTALMSIVSALIFAVSLRIGLLQIRKNRENQLRASAIALWDKYLDRTIQYPKFAYPDGFEKSFEKLEEKEIDESREKFEQYEWFVAALIRTSNEILASYDDTPQRQSMVERNIEYHRRYIAYKKSTFFRDLGPEVGKILTKAEDKYKEELEGNKQESTSYLEAAD